MAFSLHCPSMEMPRPDTHVTRRLNGRETESLGSLQIHPIPIKKKNPKRAWLADGTLGCYVGQGGSSQSRTGIYPGGQTCPVVLLCKEGAWQVAFRPSTGRSGLPKVGYYGLGS